MMMTMLMSDNELRYQTLMGDEGEGAYVWYELRYQTMMGDGEDDAYAC